jgi:thiamine-monophosphate kinase
LDAATGPRPSPGKREEGSGEGADDWDAAFLAGLAEALAGFAAPILGGDTVSLPAHAPRVITLTAIGESATAPRRSGAQAGDALYVTGTIGDAGAGLAIARGTPGPAELLAAYRRPQPRIAEGQALARQVHAMMDVSDGLLIDALRMADASGLAVAIDLARVPLSATYRAFAGEDRPARLAAATAGDDYELLFALPPDAHPVATATRIGSFAPGHGLSLTDAGEPVPLPPSLGYRHGG